jgi:alkylation response protein AidB-like acyl-CoA dehydrogenase
MSTIDLKPGFPDTDVVAEAVDGRTERRRAATAERFANLVACGRLDLDAPGSGRTRDRWAGLTALAEGDLALARLAEGHTDALAILHELGADPRPKASHGDDAVSAGPELWGVWAAEPPGTGLRATRDGAGGWRLTGLKAYCSGARSCTRALVTARPDAGVPGDTAGERRLFAVSRGAGGLRPRLESWPVAAMAASDTLDVEFDGVRAMPVGGRDAYLERPGFQHGGIGAAACWHGGARGVARTLHTAARTYDVGPHALAHLGAVCASLRALSALLDAAAAEVDADPQDRLGGAAVRSKQVRATAERTCGEVIDRVGRALGAGPLVHDADHARRVADLTVYVRQHHAERDYATLGVQLAELEWDEVAR